MQRSTMALLVAAAVLAGSAPARAQTQNHSEDGNVYYLRKANFCVIRVGAFGGLIDPQYAPSPADLDLMNDFLDVADRFLYEAETYAAKVGPVVEQQVNDQLKADLKTQLLRSGFGPDKAPAMRAAMAPQIRQCIADAEVLANRPR